MNDSSRPPVRRLAEFEVIRRLGAGGMAEVFLAKKRGAEGTFKLLVVKRILPAHLSSRRFRTMFAEEAQLATRLNHPNIVQVYDFQDYGQEGQLLSMEYVEGPDLRKLMRAASAQHFRMPPYVAAFIVSEVAKGLHYAHERKDERGLPLSIVHRDVSPQNILLSFEGAVKIADFGIATASLFREEPGVLKGKTGYMSPEQARAEAVDRRTDIYSLGVVFHELLTGRPLHGTLDGPDLLEAVRNGQVEPPSTFAREIPPELEAIAMRALARDAAGRFETTRDMAEALTRVLFQKQQLVDAHVLEMVIGQLVSREHTSPGLSPDDGASKSEAVLRSPGTGSTGGSIGEHTGSGGGRAFRLRHPSGREVRHVAVLTLRLHGVRELEIALGAQAPHFAEQLRTTLDEIAFKRGSRWAWQAPPRPTRLSDTARAVVGLLANSARAAADASWLAVDVHEALQGAGADLDLEIQASIGLVRGIAVGQRDATGHLERHELKEPAYYLADLLGAHAPVGMTWVAGGLYRLVRKDFVWGDAPTIHIADAQERKLPANMRIHALLRPLSRQERLEQASGSGELVGRDAELAELHAAYHHATSDPPQITVRALQGEMGIGKTALVNAFLAELPEQVRVVSSECAPAATDLPFTLAAGWVRQLTSLGLDHSLEQAQASIFELLAGMPGRERQEVARRLAELATGVVPEAVDEAEFLRNQRAVARGLRHLMASCARERPLVLVVEGSHWCDLASVQIIVELTRIDDPLPLLWIFVGRPHDRFALDVERLVRLELHGLTTEQQVRLLQTRLGVSQGVEQVCADLLPRAAGNPYFLLEMVDALLERGVLEIQEAATGGAALVRSERTMDPLGALPSTLEQLIADRIAELPEQEQAVVGWLAVAGEPIALQALEELSGGEREEAVTRLCARGLCDRKGDGVDVRYPLIRDVAYQVLDRTERSRMHRSLGQRLVEAQASRGLAAAVAARHFSRGRAYEQAAPLFLEAAKAARASYEVSLAIRYYRRALACLDDDDDRRFEAHEALEGIFRSVGRLRERRRHLGRLRRMARRRRRAPWVTVALLRTARFELDQGRLTRGVAAAERAEKVAADAHLSVAEVQAQVLLGDMLRDLGDIQSALSAVDRALDGSRRPDVPERLRAEVLRTRGTLLRSIGRVHEAIADHAEAVAMFHRAGARRLEARARTSLAFAMFVLGGFEDAIALSVSALKMDLSAGGRMQIAKTLSQIGQSYARIGALERAIWYLRRACEAHERYGDRDSRADTLLCTAEALLQAGQVDEAEHLVRDAGALTAVTDSAYDSVHEKLLRALLGLARGDAVQAAQHALAARQSAESQAYVSFHFYAMALEALARVGSGELHTGILLATTAMSAIETIQGSEYGLETRVACYRAFEQAKSPGVEDVGARAAAHARRLAAAIRDPGFRASFCARPEVEELLSLPGDAGPSPEPLLARPMAELRARPVHAEPVSKVGETLSPIQSGAGDDE